MQECTWHVRRERVSNGHTLCGTSLEPGREMVRRRTGLGPLAKGVVGPRWTQHLRPEATHHALRHFSILQADYTGLHPYWSLTPDLVFASERAARGLPRGQKFVTQMQSLP